MMKSIRKVASLVLFLPLMALAQGASQSDYVDWVTTQNANGGLTMPYPEWKAKMEGKTPITEPREECFNALEKNPELQILKSKVALGPLKGQTLEMLANDKKPTPLEKVALARWDALRQPCIALNQEWASKHQAPSIAILGDRVVSEFKVSLADLYAGKITYGQFAKTRQVNLDNAKAQAGNIAQQNQATQNQQNQIDRQNAQTDAQIQLQNRQQTANIINQLQQTNAATTQANAALNAANAAQAAAMKQNLPTYQPLPAVNPYQFGTGTSSPKNTNCRMIGNTMNCTSY